MNAIKRAGNKILVNSEYVFDADEITGLRREVTVIHIFLNNDLKEVKVNASTEVEAVEAFNKLFDLVYANPKSDMAPIFEEKK